MVTGEIPSNIEEKKLLISDIHPKTTYDTLVNFLEVRAKAVPSDVVYGNRRDRAVVSFESKPGTAIQAGSFSPFTTLDRSGIIQINARES